MRFRTAEAGSVGGREAEELSYQRLAHPE